jgi:hypothetical protein
MGDILLLLHAQIWVMGGTCSKLPRAIQLGLERKWVTKLRTSWNNVESLKTEASKQATKEGHTYVHTATTQGIAVKLSSMGNSLCK